MSSSGATGPEGVESDDVGGPDVGAAPIDPTSSLDDSPIDVAESPESAPEAPSDDAEPKPQVEPAAESEPHVAAEPEPQVEAATESEPQVAAEPEAGAEPEVAVEPEVATDLESVASPVDPESQPASESQPEPESQPATDSQPATESQPATDSQPEPAAATGTEPPVRSETEPATPPPAIGAVAAPSATPPAPSARKAPPAKTSGGTGRIVEGVVTEVTSDYVELTLDDGRPAVINRRNFSDSDDDPTTILSVGDRAFGAELARDDPKKRVVLSRSWALKRQAWEKVVACSEAGQTLTGKVVSTSSKGLVVDVGVRGFVPSSHLELSQVADINSYADQSLELKILEVDPRREKLVLSRRSLLLRAQRKEAQELLNSLQPGETRTGTVASLADYGAFVDLGGVSGLVHISEMSWQRVAKPSDVVAVGDQIEVKVLEVKAKKKRISLSLRQTTPDPLASLEVGRVVTGRVTRLVDFGAFVAVGDIEGLVHLSELAEYRVGNPEEVVAPGDEVGVKILSVDQRRRRVELSIRRAAEYGG